MKSFDFPKNYVYLLISAPGFMAYATCTNLERYLKEAAFIPAHRFQAAYGSMFVAMLVFRIGHNVFFAKISPFNRMVIGYAIFVAAQVIEIVAQLVTFDASKRNDWITYLVYVCGGIGMGCYDPNMLSVFSLISASARYYGVLGIVIGINIVSIGSFLFFGIAGGVLSNNSMAIIVLSVTLVSCLAAVGLLYAFVPRKEEMKAETVLCVTYITKAFYNSREWLVPLLPGIIALTCNVFAVQEFVPGITLYTIQNEAQIRVFGFTITTEYFRSIYSGVAFLANLSARMTFERTKLIFPPLFLYLDLLGALMIITGVPEIMLFGVVALEIASGGCFIEVTKYVRLVTERTEWNLLAYSFALFVSDLGSLAAGESEESLVKAICEDLRAKMQLWDVCPYY